MANYEQAKTEALAWLAEVSGIPCPSVAELKDGLALCALINNARPGTINKVNTYKSNYRMMENIDNFLKVAARLGAGEGQGFTTEDLFYENNLPKVISTLYTISPALTEKFGVKALTGDVSSLQDFANAQQIDGKIRDQTQQLGFLEAGMKKAQAEISSATMVKSKIIQSKEVSVGSAELGMIEANASQKQKMISESKRNQTDNIIKSTQQATATAELGMIDQNSRNKQKMISDAKSRGTDNIIRSRDTAVADGQLGMLDANSQKSQKMISEAKQTATDNIIKSRRTGAATADLGMMDRNAVNSQKMISSAKSNQTDHIIKSNTTCVTKKATSDDLDLDF